MSGSKRPKVALSTHFIAKKVRVETENNDPANVTDDQTTPRPTVPLSVWAQPSVDAEVADKHTNEMKNMDIATESNDELTNPVVTNCLAQSVDNVVKKETVESVVDDLKCSVCDETYKQPMMLQCLHTFCMKCIERVVTHGDNEHVTCPQCRYVTKVRNFSSTGVIVLFY